MSYLCGTPNIVNKPSSQKNGVQQAIFYTSYLWPVGAVLKIYIMKPIPEVISKESYDIKSLTSYKDTMKGYIFWKDLSDVSDGDLERYFDPLYMKYRKDGYPSPETLIKDVTDKLQDIVNITFQYTENIYESNIRILFDSTGGSESAIGITSKNFLIRDPTMRLGWLDVATVIHEFGHVLGMVHEHQTSFDNPIQWNKDAIYCYYENTKKWSKEEIDRNILIPMNSSQINGSFFDKASIMVYSFPKSIPCNGKYIQTTTNGVEIRPNFRLSNTDIEWFRAVYPFDGDRNLNISQDVIPTDQFPGIIRYNENSDILGSINNNWWKILIGVVLCIVIFFVIRIVYKKYSDRNQIINN